jgi:anti-anti-sigma factor
MTTPQVQLWKGSRFSIDRRQGNTPGTAIIRLSGPFTARDMYGALTPLELRNMFESDATPNREPLTASIFDLTDVPYMDSAGIGMIVSHYVRCRGKGIRMTAAGLTPRVQQLFKITRVDSIIPMVVTVDEADVA